MTEQKKRRRLAPSRTGALTVLAIGFSLSAILRAGEVMAERDTVQAGLDAMASAYADRVGENVVEGSAVLRELEARRSEIAREEEALAERRAAVEAAERRLEERLDQMKAVRAELEATLGEARSAASDDVAHLAETYARMRPKQAGALFNAMEPAFAAGFLAEMPSEAAAAVLASMVPERAYAVSLLLAGRHAAAQAGTIAREAAQ